MSKRTRSLTPASLTTGRVIKRKVPTDFGSEIDSADFELDPSLVQAQAGQYFTKSIGTFGDADPTDKVGSVIATQTANLDEHPASHNVPKASAPQQPAGKKDDSDEDDEIVAIFKKMGVSGTAHNGHFTPIGYTGKGFNPA
jgi:hypothetical protein